MRASVVRRYPHFVLVVARMHYSLTRSWRVCTATPGLLIHRVSRVLFHISGACLQFNYPTRACATCGDLPGNKIASRKYQVKNVCTIRKLRTLILKYLGDCRAWQLASLPNRYVLLLNASEEQCLTSTNQGLLLISGLDAVCAESLGYNSEFHTQSEYVCRAIGGV